MDALQRSRLELYVDRKLPVILRSNVLTSVVSVLLTEDDNNSIWDLLIIIPNEHYATFSAQNGNSYVFDDHDHEPPVFSKVRNLSWLKADLERRISIAIWILSNSLILSDPDDQIRNLINEYKIKFKRRVPELIKIKYLELRTERHNLRNAVRFERNTAIDIIRATVVKLALEMSFLADRQPYPYKKWLPETAESSSEYGYKILSVSKMFLKATCPDEIITLSQALVDMINDMLREKKILSDDVINQWWMHLLY
ncbi:MAG: hypothetical protein V1783_01585 [Bacteroidota bacterium]